MAKLQYLSHAAFLLESGGHRILIDPFLSDNPNAPVKQDEVACDYILLTHGHGDHVGDTIAIAKRNDAKVISNYEIVTWCSDQGVSGHPMHIGGAHEFPFGRVKFTIAHHGSTYHGDEGLVPLGNPMGALITVEGKTLYHAGDTGLFYDMKLIGEMNDIDIALLPIGDNFTMGIEDAVKAVEFLSARLAIPIHYNTFDVIEADPQVFVKQCTDRDFQAKVMEFGSEMNF